MSGGPSADGADYQLVVPVWGAQYARLCCDFLLPSLLAPGNLPGLAADRRVCLTFCCPPETRRAIEACPAHAALARLVQVVFVDNADLLASPETKYRAMTDSHYRAMALPFVRRGRTVLVFLNPDLVLSDAALSEIRAAVERGRRAVMVTGLRTRLDRMPEALEPYRRGPVLAVDGPALAGLTLGCLHPASEAFIWNRGRYPQGFTPLVFHEVAGGGLLQHCFHLHPLAVVCPDPVPAGADSIDGDFLERCGFGAADYHVVRDAAALVMVEISGEPYASPMRLGPPRRRHVAEFAVRHATEVHWFLFGHRIAFLPGAEPAPDCPELDAIVRHVRIHRFRRRLPLLDRLLLRPLFRALDAVGRRS